MRSRGRNRKSQLPAVARKLALVCYVVTLSGSLIRDHDLQYRWRGNRYPVRSLPGSRISSSEPRVIWDHWRSVERLTALFHVVGQDVAIISKERVSVAHEVLTCTCTWPLRTPGIRPVGATQLLRCSGAKQTAHEAAERS
jgi:hypothetical protein